MSCLVWKLCSRGFVIIVEEFEDFVDDGVGVVMGEYFINDFFGLVLKFNCKESLGYCFVCVGFFFVMV